MYNPQRNQQIVLQQDSQLERAVRGISEGVLNGLTGGGSWKQQLAQTGTRIVDRGVNLLLDGVQMSLSTYFNGKQQNQATQAAQALLALEERKDEINSRIEHRVLKNRNTYTIQENFKNFGLIFIGIICAAFSNRDVSKADLFGILALVFIFTSIYRLFNNDNTQSAITCNRNIMWQQQPIRDGQNYPIIEEVENEEAQNQAGLLAG